MIEAKPQNIKPMKINDFMVHVLESTALFSEQDKYSFMIITKNMRSNLMNTILSSNWRVKPKPKI